MSKDTYFIVGVLIVLYFLYSKQTQTSSNRTPRLRSKRSKGSYAASAH